MVRIGAGAGFAADRFEPAVELADRGALDYLVFEGLAERTLAQGHLARRKSAGGGFNATLERRLREVLPGCRRNRTRIITNMGAANPPAAGRMAAELAGAMGFEGLRIAVVCGDDVTSLMTAGTALPDSGVTVGEVGLPVIGANAYMGAEGIRAALDQEVDIVITGRVADPSLFLAPLAHSYGWRDDDWTMTAAGTMTGHLLECTAQVTGGYFADPGHVEVPDLAFVGYPLAEVAPDGAAVITKLEGTGGCVTELTVKQQLLYEVHDPVRYLTPDVTADFSAVTLAPDGRDRIRVHNARGTARPATLKVIVGFDGGWLAEAEMSYAGPGAAGRARMAAGIVRERMARLHGQTEGIRHDLIGFASLHASAGPTSTNSDSEDVRLRVAMRTADRKLAETLVSEVEALWVCGPAGGGGFRGRVTDSVITHAAYIPRELVRAQVEVLVA